MDQLRVGVDVALEESFLENLRSSFPEVILKDNAREVWQSTASDSGHILLAFRGPGKWDSLPAKLRWVHAASAGAENWVKALRGRNVIITDSRGVSARTVAEHAVAMLLALARKLPQGYDLQRETRWAPEQFGDMRAIADMRVAILGYGNIGRHVAALITEFGADVVVIRRSEPEVNGKGMSFMSATQIQIALRNADALIVCVPLTSSTAGLIGAQELKCLNPGAFLINVARGAVINTDALLNSLSSGHLAGAYTDVWIKEPPESDSPIWDIRNLYITPHIAWRSHGHTAAVMGLFKQNLRAFLAGAPMKNAARERNII